MNCIATQRKHCTRQLRAIARSGNRIPVQKYQLCNNIESATLKLVENIKFDFKGNLLESRRRFAQEYKQTIDWDASPALESETFATITEYDALNRATNIKTPHNGNIPASEVMPLYNEAGLLEKVDVKLRGAADATAFVEDIGYNAKGQRERIKYGNGATTKYNYDENTFRLTRLLTTRNSGADILQDLNYAYDPVGNITGIADDAQQTIYFGGSVVSPSQTFEYDALYRLTKATGREHIDNGADTGIETDGYTNAGTSVPSDSNALRNYMRQWEYDDVGNILQLIHSANNGSWTRNYSYASDSNRLNSTTVGQITVNYAYNEHGSMAAMPHLQNMEWDFAERLRHVTKGNTEAYYNYDGSGQRVRKVVEKGNVVEERLYLGGVEVFRKKVNGNLDTERETLHVMDDAKRIALVETLTVDSGSNVNSPNSVIRYQFDNHLGSASLELDENAGIISYEEYYPYGDTSYQAGRNASEVSQKRYRYTGKERDEESGLYYHGARYYACWLGRWTASDPIGVGDGVNLYAYCKGNPVRLHDPNGKQAKDFEQVPVGKEFVLDTVEVKASSGEPSFLGGTIGESTGSIGEENIIDGAMRGFESDKTAVAFPDFKDESTSLMPLPYKITASYINYAVENIFPVTKWIDTESEKEVAFETDANLTTAILLKEFATGTGKQTREFYQKIHPFADSILAGRVAEEIKTELKSKLEEKNISHQEWEMSKDTLEFRIPYSPHHTKSLKETGSKHVNSNFSQLFAGGMRGLFFPSAPNSIRGVLINPTSAKSLFLHMVDERSRTEFGNSPLTTIEQRIYFEIYK